MRSALVLLLAGALAGQAYAQDHVAMGVAAEKALKPDVALTHYQAALAADSMNYDANWRGAVAAIQVAQMPASATTMLPAPSAAVGAAPADSDSSSSSSEFTPAEEPRSLADSMYALAETYARRAVEISDKKAEGHFAVAFMLGAKSMVSDQLTQLSMAREIWEEASKAIELDPKNDAPYHILGAWYATIMKLSEFERGYAEGELGEIAQKATWDLALKNLEKAVELAPSMIFHRLDLARAYAAAGRPDDAKAQITKLEALPVAYAMDAEYQAQGKALLASLGTSGQQAQPKQP